MSYNIESGNRSLVYKTDWDVTRHFLTKNDKFSVITVNEDAQSQIIVRNNKDSSIVNFKGIENLNINSVSFSDDEKIVRIN